MGDNKELCDKNQTELDVYSRTTRNNLFQVFFVAPEENTRFKVLPKCVKKSVGPGALREKI